MGIVVSRVDDRLIHGQVATSWLRSNGIEVVIVVDDELAQDEMQKSILKMAAPPEVKVFALSVNKFVEKYQKGILDDYRVMLIFKRVSVPLELFQSGVEIRSLNVGGIRSGNGRKKYEKSLFLSDDEVETIKKLVGVGTEVEYRQLFGDQKLDVLSLIK